jgi:hypothetical protein
VPSDGAAPSPPHHAGVHRRAPDRRVRPRLWDDTKIVSTGVRANARDGEAKNRYHSSRSARPIYYTNVGDLALMSSTKRFGAMLVYPSGIGLTGMGWVLLSWSGVRWRGGQVHRYAEPASGAGGEGEGSVVCLGDALDDGQP